MRILPALATLLLALLTACATGDDPQPAEEQPAPEAGEEPAVVETGGEASWDVACAMTEEESELAYTLEIYDRESVPLYDPVTFSGDVDPA